MKSFLQYVAEDLMAKHEHHLAKVAVVFPNKRASLFLSEHLAHLSEKPIWSPAYITISDLFRNHSDRVVADPIKLVSDLHKSYIEQTGIDETLDHFYGWGQLLLADFDDIDKNMADAEKVFSNLSDIHELDDVSYLNDEQKQILLKFFSNFSPDHDTVLKQRFMRLWSKMGDIYYAFNQRLAKQGLAYEGALYREVASKPEIQFEYEHYVFVGFNLLQRVEQKLFALLKSQGKASFYWDFDRYYMPNRGQQGTDNEAGHYIAQYLEFFPNELDSTQADIYDMFSKQRDISIISSPTENAQARYISRWLLNHSPKVSGRIAAGRKTAIVLCNEGLLQTVIHCLPDEVQKVNITTGFPLIQSPVASLVTLLLNLQTTGYSTQRQCYRLKHVNAVLNHPFTKFLSQEVSTLYDSINLRKLYYPSVNELAIDEGMQLLFAHPDNHVTMLQWICDILHRIAIQAENDIHEEHTNDPLSQESLFRMYTLLNRLKGLVEKGDLEVDIITLQRLIGQLISSTSVPFHGEPIEGIQVMGVLETRNLDFDHVLILSCNEGNMPKGVNDSSFIPYNIRRAYGLTTIDHKVAIYSYYFHRLLQRASDITIVYNNSTTDGRTAEISRFVLQLMVESPHHFDFYSLQSGLQLSTSSRPSIAKDAKVLELIRKQFDISLNADKKSTALLTPTAINRYMRCPLQFYYRYVCNLYESEEQDDDTIDNRVFGNIFHEAANIIYSRLTEKSTLIQKSDITNLLKGKIDIERAVDEAFQKELFKAKDKPQSGMTEKMLNGLQLINREVIIHYLRQLLTIDERCTPFTILGLECDVVAMIETSHIKTTIGGRIDRLDKITDHQSKNNINERIRVIDYKTGGKRLTYLPDIEAVFNKANIAKHSDYYLQTILYSIIVRTQRQLNPNLIPVSPALLFIQHAGSNDYDPILRFGKDRIDDIEDFRLRFEELLTQTVDEIFNPNIDFTPTDDRQQCIQCPYQLLCTATK